ncbi:MAG TPA: mechanosensitive ion channel family protein [Polyangiaceae bacterium]
MGDSSTFVPPESSGAIFTGYLAAVLLSLLAAVLLPAGRRKRARQGAVLLVLSLLASVARALPLQGSLAQRILAFAVTFFLLGSIGRSAVVLLIDVFGERRSARPVPRIFRDLSTGAVYLFVALLALRSVDVEPGSILTTSALLTAVVGLAMQDTLGNLVSGLALQLQRPFDVGDWVELDNGQQVGRVTEVTWRATTVMTLDHVEVILPNAGLAKAAIRNYSRPSPLARRRVLVNVSSASAPHDVHDALVAAAREVAGVLAAPAPFARTRSFAESSIEYEVLFFIDDFAHAISIEGSVRDRIYYGFARNGIEMPFPTRTLHIPQADPKAKADDDLRRRASMLGSIALMESVPDDARRVLAERATLQPYGPGEAIVREGDQSMALFIVEKGRVAVEVRVEGGQLSELATLGPGQYFGEMGLLTGEVRSATVRAKTRCDLLVIDHDAFHAVLASHPEVIDRLGSLLAMRQAEIGAAKAAGGAVRPPEERSRRLISQIREFFKIE